MRKLIKYLNYATCVFILIVSVNSSYGENSLTTIRNFGGDYVVKGHFGGDVNQTIKYGKQIVKTHDRIVIDGECFSACLYLISDFVGANVCATENAKLGMHSIIVIRKEHNKNVYIDNNHAKISESGTNILLDSLPKGLSDYYKSVYIPSVYKGDSLGDLAIVSGEKVQELIGKCN